MLVAEDNAVNRLVICRLLEKHGIEVRTAADGEDCVEQWKGNAPDLILMDCQMPRCDGYEATRRIRQAATCRLSRSPPTPWPATARAASRRA